MPDAEFEKTFADLAHAQLRDRAPGLLDYLVGFQLLDKADDDTRAVGVWGFKVGSEMMYAPVFFLNGQLKGDDLLYLKSQDAFVPLKENWINYLLNRKPHVLGEYEPRQQQDLGIRQPDYNVLSRPPHTGSKYASAGDLRSLTDYLTATVHPDFQPFLPVIMAAPGGEKRASLIEKWDLCTFIKKAGAKVARRLIATMRKEATFCDAVMKYYSMDDLIKAAEEAFTKSAANSSYPVSYPRLGKKVRVVKTGDSHGKHGTITKVDETRTSNDTIESDGTEVRKSKESKDVTVTLTGGGTFKTQNCEADLVDGEYDDDDSPVKEAADGDRQIEGTSPKVRVMVADSANVKELDQQMLSDSEKERLQRDRYLVQDDRNDDQVSKPYHRQIGKTLQNPHGNGYVNVLRGDSDYIPCLVIKNPHKLGGSAFKGHNEGWAITVDMAKKVCHVSAPQDIYIDNELHDDEAWGAIWDKLPAASSARVGNKVIFVNRKCEGSVPYVVKNRVTSDGQTRLYGRTAYHKSDNITPTRRAQFYPETPLTPWQEQRQTDKNNYAITLTGKEGQNITQIQDTLYVPNGYKVIKIDQRADPMILTDPQALAVTEMNMFKTGHYAELSPITDGIEWWVQINGNRGAPMRKIAALQSLILDHGLRQSDAESLLKLARKNGAPKYLIKRAAPSAPPIPEPTFATDPDIGNATVQYPMTDLISANPDELPSYGEPYMDMNATYQAEQAAQQGQKEVMDTSVISGLVKSMDPNRVVDDYLGDMMLGLDRIGRIKFMYYWHWDKFKERFGGQDMPELEDNLNNVFENLGDLTLFLKQKTIEPEVSGASAEAELSQVLG